MAQSLNAATATGAGTAASLASPAWNHTMIVRITGAPTACTVVLEGTLDGTVWFAIEELDGTNATQVVNRQIALDDVRANLTVLTGGTTPTVSAEIISV